MSFGEVSTGPCLGISKFCRGADVRLGEDTGAADTEEGANAESEEAMEVETATVSDEE
jgi:hypothetical protein